MRSIASKDPNFNGRVLVYRIVLHLNRIFTISYGDTISRLLPSYFFHLRELPYWMLFPVKVHTKSREGLMSDRF